MDRKEIAKQLEWYSNAIVAFIVFQGLVFCYNYGTNEQFHSIVIKTPSLSIGLVVLFLVCMTLALFANYYIRLKLEGLIEEYALLLKTIYFGKAVVISFFGALPIVIVSTYAIFNAN